MTSLLDRRGFLKVTSGVVLGLGHFKGSAHAGPQGGFIQASPADWQDLARSLDGRLLQKDHPDFRRIAKPWNLYYTSTLPEGIARCASAEDVRTSLLWAASHDVPLAIRSGGHSYAGYSTTSGLLIDVSSMNEVDVPDAEGRVRAWGRRAQRQCLCRLRPVNRAITHGRCMAVGVAGLVLGGGIGFSQRRRGLTCDQLTETEVITAAGDRLLCNERENADLFWACRGGGGGNFGVNVSFTFQTFPVDAMTVFKLVWTDRLDEILPAALDLLPTTPDRLGCKLSVETTTPIELELMGQLVGTEAELRALLAPLYRIGAPAKRSSAPSPIGMDKEFSPRMRTTNHERSRYAFKPLLRKARVSS